MIDYNEYHILYDYKGWVPYNSCSDGEGYIRRNLDRYGYKCIWQQAIEIPKSINPSGLAFLDLFVPELNLVIEYNGGQHYDINNEKQQLRDNYVKGFCKAHNLYLVEIDSLAHRDPNQNRYGLPFKSFLESKTLEILRKAILINYRTK